MKAHGTAWIGTSNIVVPGNKSTYPEAYRDKSRLYYYSSIFNSLEINSSFYKIPMASTFRKWSEDVAGDFTFSVKLFKEITHVKELNFESPLIDKFLEASGNLGEKLGCLLIQFPGKIGFDYFSQVEDILSRIRSLNANLRIAVEVRNPGWYVRETSELLEEYKASLVLHDIPRSKNENVNSKAAFMYIRFHGPTGNYRGGYTDEELLQYAQKINIWLKKGKDVYAYFNNTMGSALENALTLKKYLSSR